MLAARTILKTIEKRRTLLLLNLGSNVGNQVGNDIFSKKQFSVRNYGNKPSNRNSTERNANSRYLADEAEEARESSRDSGLRRNSSGSRPSYNPRALVDMDKEENDEEDEDEMKSFEQGYSSFRERTGKPPSERPSRPKEWSKPPMRKAPKGEKLSREKPKQLQSEKTSRYIEDDADETEEGAIDANEDEEETEPGVHPSNKKELQRIAETQEKMKKFNTVFDIYRYAVTEFTRNELTYGHSTLNAAEDASFLLLHELGLPFDRSVEFWGSSVLLETEKAHLLKLIRVRIDSRLPMAYIVRGCYQQGEYFYVDRRVIVPRSFLGEVIRNMEKYFPKAAASTDLMTKPLFHQGKPQQVAKPTTATTVEVQEMSYEDYFPEITDEKQFMKSSSGGTRGEELDPTPAPLSVSPDDISLTPSSSSSSSSPLPSFISAIDSFDPTKIKRILDIGTGSGCLAILAAKYFPNVERIDAIDISEEALAVARINIKFHNLNEMVFPFQGDLFNAVPNHANYDLIIANPPYVNKRRMEHFPKEYTYEPKQAFDGGGQHGLLIVKRILLESAQYLNRGGYLLCEIGETKRALEKLFNSYEIKKYYDNDSRKLPEITYLNTKLSKNEIIMFRKEQLPNYSPPAKKVVFLEDDAGFSDPIPGITDKKQSE
jgi:methylase of polypeptide subunit release factors